MPFNGAGLFVPVAFPDYPAVAGELIKASMFNANVADLHSGLSNCLTRNGQSPALANLPMAGYRHTGVGAAASDTDYARWDQVLQRNAPGGVFFIGDFSNATLASRLGFKTSEANAGTTLSLNPNGTGNASGYRAYNTADPTNSAFAQLSSGLSASAVTVGKTGTGAYQPLEISVGGSTRYTFGVGGQFGLAGANFGNAGEVLMSTGAGTAPQWAAASGGSVSSFALTTANGFSGSVTTPLTTPNLTLATTVTGMVKGSASAFVAATANTDYLAPGGYTSRNLTMATSRMLGRSTAGTGQAEEISVGTGLSLSGGVLACTVSGGVNSVGGYSGTVTNGQVAAAATAGYGYTPANGASYVPKDLAAGNWPIGIIVSGRPEANGATHIAGSTYSGNTILHIGGFPVLPAGTTWRVVGGTGFYSSDENSTTTNYTAYQRIA